MKLAGSLIVKNELGRYLEPCIDALAEFCDVIRVVDDGSTDGSYEFLDAHPLVEVLRNPESPFDEHEAEARNCLLEWTTCDDDVTHVLAIDADEFVADGPAIRSACLGSDEVWTVLMQEVWRAEPERLWLRQDGGWREHPVPVLYRVPETLDDAWWIPNRRLASGRVPQPVSDRVLRSAPTRTEILHFGWARESERVAREERYRRLDGGRYHALSHLNSILHVPPTLEARPWPELPQQDRILAVATDV